MNSATRFGEVLEIGLSKQWVNITSEDALMAEIPQGEVEAAEPSEEVNELQRLQVTSAPNTLERADAGRAYNS